MNFAKYPFEECMARVFKELKQIIMVSVLRDEIKMASVLKEEIAIKPSSSPQASKHSVSSWTNTDVNNWISKNQFDKKIIQVLSRFTGEQLVSFNSIRLQVPAYFYKSIGADLVSAVQLTCELEKLFKT